MEAGGAGRANRSSLHTQPFVWAHFCFSGFFFCVRGESRAPCSVPTAGAHIPHACPGAAQHPVTSRCCRRPSPEPCGARGRRCRRRCPKRRSLRACPAAWERLRRGTSTAGSDGARGGSLPCIPGAAPAAGCACSGHPAGHGNGHRAGPGWDTGRGTKRGSGRDTERGAPCDTERDRDPERAPKRDRASPGAAGCRGAAARPLQPIRTRIQNDAPSSANQNADSRGCGHPGQLERGFKRLLPQPISRRTPAAAGASANQRARSLRWPPWLSRSSPVPSPVHRSPAARTDPSLPALDVPCRARRSRGAVSVPSR